MRLYLLTAVAAVALVTLLPSRSHAQPGTFLGKDATAWEAELSRGDAKARRSAVFALGKLGKLGFASTGKLLDAFQTDEDAAVRDAAAIAVGEIYKSAFNAKTGKYPDGAAKAAAVLCERLKEETDPMVRRSAVFALGNLCKAGASEGIQAALDRAVDDPSPSVRQTAAWALGEAGPKGVKSLIKALADKDSGVVRSAATALTVADDDLQTRLDRKLIRDALAAKLSDTNVETKKAVLFAVMKVATADDAPALVGKLQVLLGDAKEDRDVRFTAAMAMALIGGDAAAAALPELRAALNGKALGLRRAAAASIGNIGKPAIVALDDLTRALSDPDPIIRENAATSVGSIGNSMNPVTKKNAGKPADPLRAKIIALVPTLIKLLDDVNQPFEVRKAAIIALKDIGPLPNGNQAVLDVLVKTATDKKNGESLRAFALWPIRFYKESEKDKNVLGSLNKILETEPVKPANKDLRYDTAYLLAKYEKGKVSEKALDTLLEFLRDDQVFIAGGAVVGPVNPNDKKVGGAKVGIGKGKDGRLVAIAGIRSVINDKFDGDSKRVLKRLDIMQQLRSIAGNATLNKELRKMTKEVIDYLES